MKQLVQKYIKTEESDSELFNEVKDEAESAETIVW
jgi:hypothetical protein